MGLVIALAIGYYIFLVVVVGVFQGIGHLRNPKKESGWGVLIGASILFFGTLALGFLGLFLYVVSFLFQ